MCKIYRRKGIFTAEQQNLESNHHDHTDFLKQVLRKSLGINVSHIDDRIKELKSQSSKHSQRLLEALENAKMKKMGQSRMLPEYVVKNFLEPMTQCVITEKHTSHWDSTVMAGLYHFHKYVAISKENTKEGGSEMVTLGYCPLCSYATGNHGSINNHICKHY